eukprot:TRINITY_DN8543_c0_g1_i22.p1 TRINITY_DN8543_c0_g1~~TRINITY_DN8543_c0_g1_i22.p1  ORF type:complete len:179 (+),score=40.22 TRINITY_DN8543_c0_g1_i22:1092-1628(+)
MKDLKRKFEVLEQESQREIQELKESNQELKGTVNKLANEVEAFKVPRTGQALRTGQPSPRQTVEKNEGRETSTGQELTPHLPDEVITATIAPTITQPPQTPRLASPKPRRVSLDEKLQAVVDYLRDNGQQTEQSIKDHFSEKFCVNQPTVSHWLLTLRQNRRIEDKIEAMSEFTLYLK